MRQQRVTVRGKGSKESRKVSFDAIYTFDEPLYCTESNVPLGGGYFLGDDGQAEVTQLIGHFNCLDEREDWIAEILEVIDEPST